MSEEMSVQSHKGLYTLHFAKQIADAPPIPKSKPYHIIIDSNVLRLHATALAPLLTGHIPLVIEANEGNKALECIPGYIETLSKHGLRRDHLLVAIGGGVIQDITCFLSAVTLRGVPWQFYPTTLLSQADSCLGSKSSINVRGVKNLVGTFTPPTRIVLCQEFLNSLETTEIYSGLGEILKIHLIAGLPHFFDLAKDYDKLITDDGLLQSYIQASLKFKRYYAEKDEFDRGVRNVLNYGHTFGHALETATDFFIPHGIAVTVGMDMANTFAVLNNGFSEETAVEIRQTLRKNYLSYVGTSIDCDKFIDAIAKDKKNSGNQLGIILPDSLGKIEKRFYANDGKFRSFCERYFEEIFVR